MFVVCALIPIVALAIVSYSEVTKQLTDQSLNRLRQSAKSQGLMIYENLVLADNQLATLHTLLAYEKDGRFSSLPQAVTERSGEIFSGIALIGANKAGFSWGKGVSDTGAAKILTIDLTNNEVMLLCVRNGSEWPEIVVVRRVEISGHARSFLVGVVKPSFLWGMDQGSSLPPASEFSVMDDQGNHLFSSLGPLAHGDRGTEGDRTADGPTGSKEVTIQNKPYYASSWSVFLKPKFHVPSWTVTVMEPRDYVLEPMNYFSKVFPPIILLSFVIVVWLSNGAIRKSLVPIDSLMEGARKVANREFQHRVEVKSNDEFRDLAEAFNSMTSHLDIQFKVLSARSDLDRAILSTLDMEQIIETSLSQSSRLFPFTVAAISIMDPDNPMVGRSFIHERNPSDATRVASFSMSKEEYRALDKNRQWLCFKATDASKPSPSYLVALQRSDAQDFVVLPILLSNRLFGLLSMGTTNKTPDSQFDLGRVRAFCDHLAVAFSNSNLIRELRQLNMGALQALALTVDAKSPWTAGHSLRVARMAVQIGGAMGLPQENVDDLERASLLHDIGKIAISLSILDKDSKLTDDEYAIIKEHPARGARILSPVPAYARIIPIVEQHHERFDGRGYPKGLKAYEIDLGARILAVADSYDAMVSDRPYRKSLGRERAMEIVYEEAGHQFDPAVVAAFNSLVQTGGISSSPHDGDLLRAGQMISQPYHPGCVLETNERMR